MMDSREKTVCLVTGAAGFIGGHLTERLIADGHRVVAVDDLSTGRRADLARFDGNPLFRFHQADVADKAAITPLFAGVDWVFHLAARADIVPSIVDPAVYHHANVDGTLCVLEAARDHAVKRFIYAASSSCYGLPDISPTPETAEIRPMYPYALTKNVGEQYVMHWQQVYGLPAMALRLFNVFGPRHRTTGSYGAVFGVFLAQILAGQPLTIVGDGEQTRDFTFVTDVVDAFLAAAASSHMGEAMNVGSGGTYSVNLLADLLGGERVYIPKRPGEPDCTFADISKIQRMLNWRPTVPFERGVEIMIHNIDYWREAPVWTPDSIEVATRDWFKYLEEEGT